MVINEEDVVGIFDLDNTTVSKISREYLNLAEKNGKVINVSDKLPKSFIVSEYGGDERVYISQLLPATLSKRKEDLLIQAEYFKGGDSH